MSFAAALTLGLALVVADAAVLLAAWALWRRESNPWLRVSLALSALGRSTRKTIWAFDEMDSVAEEALAYNREVDRVRQATVTLCSPEPWEFSEVVDGLVLEDVKLEGLTFIPTSDPLADHVPIRLESGPLRGEVRGEVTKKTADWLNRKIEEMIREDEDGRFPSRTLRPDPAPEEDPETE